MKRFLAIAALAGASTLGARADISLILDSVIGSGPYTYSYLMAAGWTDGDWYPGQTPTVILFDVAGYVPGSAVVNPNSNSGLQQWSVDDSATDMGLGDNPGLTDLVLTFTGAGLGDTAPLGQDENGITPDDDFFGQYYGDLVFQSSAGSQFPGFGYYEVDSGNPSGFFDVPVPYIRDVDPVPEASSVAAVGLMAAFGGVMAYRRRKQLAK